VSSPVESQVLDEPDRRHPQRALGGSL
jgi:hypothetical protein